MKTKQLTFLLLIVFVCYACNNKKERNKKLLASVGEYTLYLEDIPLEKRTANTEMDSSERVQQYVLDWTKEKFFLLEAKSELPDEIPAIQALVEEYKQNLLRYELEKKWLDAFIDTVVSIQEIEKYYEENKEHFLLRRNIVKIRYIKVDESISNNELTKLKTWIQIPNDKNDSLLRKFGEDKAENFFVDNVWLYFDDILQEIPISSNFNQERYLQNNKFVQLKENGRLYLLYFVDMKIKDSVTPLEFEQDRIKDYLLIQKKTQWLDKLKLEKYEEGLRTKAIQIEKK
jgi:hypothetical protein